MENLYEKYKNNTDIIKGLERLNLLTKHPKYKVGQFITFHSAYYSNALFLSRIQGFDKHGYIYVLWDCYWLYIEDNSTRDINIIDYDNPVCIECHSNDITSFDGVTHNAYCNNCENVTHKFYNSL